MSDVCQLCGTSTKKDEIKCQSGHSICQQCYKGLDLTTPYTYEKKCPFCRSVYLDIYKMPINEIYIKMKELLDVNSIINYLKELKIHEKTPRNISQYNYILMIVWMIDKYNKFNRNISEFPEIVQKYLKKLEKIKYDKWMSMCHFTFGNLANKMLNINVMKDHVYFTSFTIEDYYMKKMGKQGFGNILYLLSKESEKYIKSLSTKIEEEDENGVDVAVEQSLLDVLDILVGDDDISIIDDVYADIKGDDDFVYDPNCGDYMFYYNGIGYKYCEFLEKLGYMSAIPLHPDDWFISFNNSYLKFNLN